MIASEGNALMKFFTKILRQNVFEQKEGNESFFGMKSTYTILNFILILIF